MKMTLGCGTVRELLDVALGRVCTSSWTCSGGGVGVECSATDTEVPGSIHTDFSASVSETLALDFGLFYLSVVLSQNQSFFPSSASLLFLWVQVVQSKQTLFLYLCSLSTWHCWIQASIRNCCFVVQWNRQKNTSIWIIVMCCVKYRPCHTWSLKC